MCAHKCSRTPSTFYFVIPSHYHIIISPHHQQCRRRHWLELAAMTTAATTKAVLHSRCLPASSSWHCTSRSRCPHSGYSTRSRSRRWRCSSRIAIWGSINRAPKWSASSRSCCSRSSWSWSCGMVDVDVDDGDRSIANDDDRIIHEDHDDDIGRQHDAMMDGH